MRGYINWWVEQLNTACEKINYDGKISSIC